VKINISSTEAPSGNDLSLLLNGSGRDFDPMTFDYGQKVQKVVPGQGFYTTNILLNNCLNDGRQPP